MLLKLEVGLEGLSNLKLERLENLSQRDARRLTRDA
jgi:hypothetical protein